MKRLIILLALISASAFSQSLPTTFVTSGVKFDGARTAYFAVGHVVSSGTVPVYSTLEYADHQLGTGMYIRLISTKYVWIAADALAGSNDAGSASFKLSGVIGVRLGTTGVNFTWKPAGVVVNGRSGQMVGLLVAF